MACTFQLGETVVLTQTITDQDDVPVNPDTSMTVTITDPDGVTIVDDAAMTNTGTVGSFQYDHNSNTSQTAGLWTACYKSVDNSKTTIVPDKFFMVACP